MKYKVLVDWRKFTIEWKDFNPEIHRHLSGREFTKEDGIYSELTFTEKVKKTFTSTTKSSKKK